MSHDTMPLTHGDAARKGRALIVGAGIGGLALAGALRKIGFDVCVFEQAPTLSAGGAGFMLHANALLALRVLGLDALTIAGGRTIATAKMRQARGAVLKTLSFAAVARAVGAPAVGIARAALQEVLLSALGDARDAIVRLGAAVERFNDIEGGVEVEMSGGRRERGDFLVAADGLHSVVRQQLVGDGAPRYAGYTSWRGVVRAPHAGHSFDEVQETLGRGARFGVVPIGGGGAYWFATANVAPGQKDVASGRRAEVLRRFAAWHDPIPALVAATDESEILRTDIRDRPPITRWSRGRVVLIGDAAHPMTPNLGQGAGQTIEDAVVLARALGEAPDIAQAFAIYERKRVARANALTLRSRRFGALGQVNHPLAVGARDALLFCMPARFFLKGVRDASHFVA